MIGLPDINDIGYGGAVGGGKSDGIIGSWIKHNAMFGKYTRGIIFRKSMPELEHIKLRCLEILTLIGGSYNSQKSVWTMPNGGLLFLRFMERDTDVTKYQGHEFTFIAIDELGNWKKAKIIDPIFARLRTPHGIPCQSLTTFNPGGPGHEWVKKRYIKPSNIEMIKFIEAHGVRYWRDLETNTTRVFIPAKLTHNRILIDSDPNYIDRIAAACQGQPELLKAWLLGDWDIHPEGGIMSFKWLQNTYDVSKPLPAFEQVIMSCDTASKDNQLVNDPSVFGIWGYTKPNDYLLHVERGWWKYPDLKAKFRMMADKWGPSISYIEDKSTGQSLFQEMIAEGYPCKPINPTADKMTRFSNVTGWFESGIVLLPDSARWKADYVDELLAAPDSAHFDQIDMTSQYLSEKRGNCHRSLDSILNGVFTDRPRGSNGSETIEDVFASMNRVTGRGGGLGEFDRGEFDRW